MSARWSQTLIAVPPCARRLHRPDSRAGVRRRAQARRLHARARRPSRHRGGGHRGPHTPSFRRPESMRRRPSQCPRRGWPMGLASRCLQEPGWDPPQNARVRTCVHRCLLLPFAFAFWLQIRRPSRLWSQEQAHRIHDCAFSTHARSIFCHVTSITVCTGGPSPRGGCPGSQQYPFMSLAQLSRTTFAFFGGGGGAGRLRSFQSGRRHCPGRSSPPQVQHAARPIARGRDALARRPPAVHWKGVFAVMIACTAVASP